jgi:hypothetical protein
MTFFFKLSFSWLGLCGYLGHIETSFYNSLSCCEFCLTKHHHHHISRQILAVHTLVAEPTEDLDSWLELVTLCRKEHMFPLCENILRTLGAKIEPRVNLPSIASNSRDSFASILGPTAVDHNNSFGSMPHHNSEYTLKTIPSIVMPEADPRVVLATHKYWWQSGEKAKALAGLTDYIASLEPHATYLASLLEKKSLLKHF